MRSTQTAALLFALLLALSFTLGACRETPLVPDANSTPIADAQFINAAGKSVDEIVAKDDPMALQIPYNGQPVAVTLNGLASKDDGKIKAYKWLSGDKGPMDKGRAVIAIAPTPQPVVMLGMGTFKFVLWVTDDKGVVSTPDSVTVTVGSGSGGADDPAVVECASNVFDMVSDPCKMCICSQSADCRTKVVETACNQDCWGLISCIADNCPDFAAMAAMMDYSCFTAAGCTTFIAGMAGATMAGPCVTPCAAMCRSGMAMPAADAGM